MEIGSHLTCRPDIRGVERADDRHVMSGIVHVLDAIFKKYSGPTKSGHWRR